MITALGFMLFNIISYFLAYRRGPFWGLFAYLNIYFNVPNDRINWWVTYLPFDRWSLLTTFVLITSLLLHRDKLSQHKFGNTRWVFIFLALSAIITYTSAIDFINAKAFLFKLVSYALFVYILIKSINHASQLRLILITIVAMCANVSLNAYLYGKRINARLEGVGSADANGANLFALLLAGIIPIIFVFIKEGKTYERVIAILSLPLVLNAFVLCNSRGSTVALAGGIFVAVMLVADNKIRRGVIALGIIVAPVFLHLADDEFISRFTTLFEFSSALEDSTQARNLSSGRTEIWDYGMQMASDHPFGVGPNGFKKLARFYMPKEVLTFLPGAQHGQRAAHNTYLQVIVEQGILGIIIWLALCFHTSWFLYRAFKLISSLKERKPFLRLSIFALNVSFFTSLIGALVTSRIYYEFFWWQVAFAAIVYSIVRQMQENETEDTDADAVEPERKVYT